MKGNGYVFKELADRGYGRLEERVEIDRGPYGDLSDEQLQRQIAELERKLGVPSSQPEVRPPADDDSKSSKPPFLVFRITSGDRP